jgi:hypothetical protein
LIERTSGTAVTVQLWWIPLGAGAHTVRLNGIAYEALVAARQGRSRCELYHSVLGITLGNGATYTVEIAPEPDGRGTDRGVVVVGPVGARALARLRVFRYEVRRWRDGIVPDLTAAVEPTVTVTVDDERSRRTFEAIAHVPPLTWGRDLYRLGDRWTCNSIISWALTSAGFDTTAIPLPPNGRAPGWHAGRVVASSGPSALPARRVPAQHQW